MDEDDHGVLGLLQLLKNQQQSSVEVCCKEVYIYIYMRDFTIGLRDSRTQKVMPVEVPLSGRKAMSYSLDVGFYLAVRSM